MANRADRVRQTLLFLNNRAFDHWVLRRSLQLIQSQIRYDFVLGQDFLSVRVVRQLAARLSAPCGATLHDTLPQQVAVGAPNAFVRNVLRLLSQRRDQSLAPELTRFKWLAAVSRHVGDSALRWLQPSPPPLHIVYNPAPVAFTAVPPLEVPPTLRFLFVGRLSPEKGVDLLVEAFRKLPGEHRLTILGLAGSLAAAIHQAAAADPRIEVRAAVPYSEMPKVYAEHQVVCCPVMWDEPFGLTVLEGRVTRRVVIGTHRGGLPEILDGYPRAALFHATGSDRVEHVDHLRQALSQAEVLARAPLNEAHEAAFLKPFQLSTFAATYERLIHEAVAKRGC
ncbi:MAG TPA: hypothetical protein DCE44_08690 [Verrucomicrobiales bacterium]|nr:hypothetical protein [Verrucomicrobiales bacterium]